jgi:hypothetical protein
MASTQEPSFWTRILFGALSLFHRIERQTTAVRDARLKSYASRLSWEDNRALLPTVKMGFSTVYAESEQQARELSQAQAIKELPLITSKLSDKKIVPPYMTDPAGTLPRWEIGEGLLSDDERDRASKGQLGPPRAMHLMIEATIG